MANLVQFKRMLMFCLEDWGRAGPPCLRH